MDTNPNPSRFDAIIFGVIAWLIASFISLILAIPIYLIFRLPAWAILLVQPLPVAIGGLTCLGSSVYRIERRRRRLGQCIRCGYDLRESVVRCPECGKKFRR